MANSDKVGLLSHIGVLRPGVMGIISPAIFKPGFQMNDSHNSTNGRLNSVQALRGLAAVLVVLYHARDTIFIGDAGIDLFFVISGFVMVYTCQDHFGNKDAIKPFLLRRVLRIYPVYWIGTLLFLTVIAWPSTYHRYITSFFLIPTAKLPILSPGWTLTYEMAFYLIFAFCLRFDMRKAIICVCLVLVSIICLRTALSNVTSIQWGESIALEFGIGCIIAYMYCNGIRFGRLVSLALMIAGAIALSMPVEFRFLLQDPFRVIFWGGGSALAFMGLVFGPKINFLDNRILQRLGNASYSIYISHLTIVVGMFDSPYRGVAASVVSIIFGLGFYEIIEKPMMANLNQRFRQYTRMPTRGLNIEVLSRAASSSR